MSDGIIGFSLLLFYFIYFFLWLFFLFHFCVNVLMQCELFMFAHKQLSWSTDNTFAQKRTSNLCIATFKDQKNRETKTPTKQINKPNAIGEQSHHIIYAENYNYSFSSMQLQQRNTYRFIVCIYVFQTSFFICFFVELVNSLVCFYSTIYYIDDAGSAVRAIG